MLPFAVVGCCRNCPGDSVFELGVVKNQIRRYDFDSICHSSRYVNISCFGGDIAINGYKCTKLQFIHTLTAKCSD